MNINITKTVCDWCGEEFKHQDNIVTVSYSEYKDKNAAFINLVYKTFRPDTHFHVKCFEDSRSSK